MRKTQYFCNLCGEEVDKKDVVEITLRFETVITEAGLRPREWLFSGHLHEDCLNGFGIALQKANLAIALEQKSGMSGVIIT